MTFVAPLIVMAVCVSVTTAGADSSNVVKPTKEHTTLTASPASAVQRRQLQPVGTRTGFVTIALGTSGGCTPVTGIIRVQLGVCARQGFSNADGTPLYSINHVQATATHAQWTFEVHNDAACATPPLYTYSYAYLNEGCGIVQWDTNGGQGNYFGYHLNNDFHGYNGLNVGVTTYGTVTYETGFAALPAGASALSTWGTAAVYANTVACARSTTNSPVFFVAWSDYCGEDVMCSDTGSTQILGEFGASITKGCTVLTNGNIIKSGFVTMTLGTDTACTPVSSIIRVALGVCAQQGNSNNDDYVNNRQYVMNYVLRTGNNAQLVEETYIDSACSTPHNAYAVASFVEGCGLLQVDDFQTGFNDDLGYLSSGTGAPGLGLQSPLPKYATVTIDAGFNALPAASSVSATWKALSIYAHGDACAQPATNAPVFFAATPVAVMDTCTVNVACTDIRVEYQNLGRRGATWTEGCVTVAPKTTGYMMVTQWTGDDPQQV